MKEHKSFVEKCQLDYVVSAVESKETTTSFFATPFLKRDWQQISCKQVALRTPDFQSMPLLLIHSGVMLIKDIVGERKKVLIHCKAGKTRSASLVVAYLSTFGGFGLEKSLKYVKEKRPMINLKRTKKTLVLWQNCFVCVKQRGSVSSLSKIKEMLESL